MLFLTAYVLPNGRVVTVRRTLFGKLQAVTPKGNSGRVTVLASGRNSVVKFVSCLPAHNGGRFYKNRAHALHHILRTLHTLQQMRKAQGRWLKGNVTAYTGVIAPFN